MADLEKRSVLVDSQGLQVTCSATLLQSERGEFLASLNEYMHQVFIYGNNWSIICRAHQLDPSHPLVNVLMCDYYLAKEDGAKAMHHLSLARQQIEEHRSDSNDREQRYVSAWSTWLCEGDTAKALDMMDKLLDDYPDDLFVGKRATLLAFLLGDDAAMLKVLIDKGRYERWRQREYYHGMMAFALEQNGWFRDSLRCGLVGSQQNKDDAWAHHGVAHALYSLARVQDGITWMEKRTEAWTQSMSFMYTHNWFHILLFYIDEEKWGPVNELFKHVWSVDKAEQVFESKEKKDQNKNQQDEDKDSKPSCDPSEESPSSLFALHNPLSSEDQLGAMGLLWKWEMREVGVKRLQKLMEGDKKERQAEHNQSHNTYNTTTNTNTDNSNTTTNNTNTDNSSNNSNSTNILTTPARLPSLDSSWSSVMNLVTLPTPHISPFFDVWTVHGLCRVGRYDEAQRHVDSMHHHALSLPSPSLSSSPSAASSDSSSSTSPNDNPVSTNGSSSSSSSSSDSSSASSSSSSHRSRLLTIVIPVAKAVMCYNRGDMQQAYELMRPFVGHLTESVGVYGQDKQSEKETKHADVCDGDVDVDELLASSKVDPPPSSRVPLWLASLHSKQTHLSLHPDHLSIIGGSHEQRAVIVDMFIEIALGAKQYHHVMDMLRGMEERDRQCVPYHADLLSYCHERLSLQARERAQGLRTKLQKN